ncbi:MAG: hypothetical protein ABEJ48_01685, partial [Halobacteriales archaeon]
MTFHRVVTGERFKLEAAIIGVILLETYEPRVVSATFLQPLPEAARSASGEHALDARKVRKRQEKVLKTADDGIAIVR